MADAFFNDIDMGHPVLVAQGSCRYCFLLHPSMLYPKAWAFLLSVRWYDTPFPRCIAVR